ncbi:LacI family DNA-binding transcriptional regulator [Thalassiella azotivora]
MTTHDDAARVTIFDVAKEAGVSYSTVSRVVNGRPHIAAETRARVERAMRSLGYVADLRARSLAGGRTQILGLVLNDVASSYMASLVAAVDTSVATTGYDLMLCTTHSRAGRVERYLRQLTSGLVDGLIVLNPPERDTYLAPLRDRRFPHVVVDHDGPRIGSSVVRPANWSGAQEGVHHLVGLGHTRIGVVGGDPLAGSAQVRQRAQVAALVEAGLPTDGLVETGGFLVEDGYRAGRALLDRPDRPTAVVTGNDLAALGVMEAARSLGLDVPADLSVVGFDDVIEARLTRPSLTTVHQPFDALGATATSLLLELVAQPGLLPRTVELPAELVVRGSTAPPGTA